MQFDPEVAKDVGTDAAIILSNIQFWVAKNRANNKNLYEGRYWTYNSVAAFNKQFDYLTPSKIRTCLSKLEEKGYIVTGEFNTNKYDRSKWYSSQLDLLELTNGLVETDKPIPYSKPDNIKQNNNIGLASLENKGWESIILDSEDSMHIEASNIIKVRRELKWSTPFVGAKRESQVAIDLLRKDSYKNIVANMRKYEKHRQDEFMPSANSLDEFSHKYPTIKAALDKISEWS